jgi:serine/threonine protein kinase
LKYNGFPYTAVFMELCSGSLAEFLNSPYYRQLTPEQKSRGNRDIVRQISTGLSQCHNQNPQLVHRDLKADNGKKPRFKADPPWIVVYNWQAYRPDGSYDINFKLVDFGIARPLLPNPHSPLTTLPRFGLPDWMAPELATGGYGCEVDLYSLGKLMERLELFGAAPDSQFTQLQKDLTNPDPARRPSLSQVRVIMEENTGA